MFFTQGFLGTHSPFYLDCATLYFALLPFLVIYSISFAVKKQIKKHFVSQMIILFLTLLIVLVFELGLRLDGGFKTYAEYSSLNYTFLLVYLLAHILLSLITLVYWIYFVYRSYSSYKSATFDKKHKNKGKLCFLLIFLTSLTGVILYFLLFVF